MKKYVLMTAIAVNLMSCNRSENDETVTESIPVLPTKITLESKNGESANITLNYNGSKLTEVNGIYGTGKIFFEYSNNLISKIVEKDGEDVIITNLEYTNNKLTKTITTGTEDNGMYNFSNETTYVYRNDRTVIANEIGTSNSQNYTASTTYTITNNQATKYISTRYSTTTTHNISYDEKNSIFKNITGFKEASLALNSIFFIKDFSTTQNNYISISTDEQSSGNYSATYQYTYNSNNYPSKSIYNYKYGSLLSSTITYTITYNK
ncbi:hypothetical protein PG623_09550 [Riemerella anatipestifer]|nr:hypothetical protein [Riemerella anatipestifer]